MEIGLKVVVSKFGLDNLNDFEIITILRYTNYCLFFEHFHIKFKERTLYKLSESMYVLFLEKKKYFLV